MYAEAVAEDEDIVEVLEQVVGWVISRWLCHGSMLLHQSTLVVARPPPF